MSDAETTEIGDISMEATFHPLDGGSVTLQQRYLGLSPAVLIEPEMDESGDVVFQVNVWGPTEAESLAQLLETIVTMLRQDNGTWSEESVGDGDGDESA